MQLRMGEGEVLKQRRVLLLRYSGVRKCSYGRDDHELINPILLDASKNIQILLCKSGLHLKEFREFPKLIDLVFLDSVHSSSDIFQSLFAGGQVQLCFGNRIEHSLFTLADVQLNVGFFFVFVFLGVLQPLYFADRSVVVQPGNVVSSNESITLPLTTHLRLSSFFLWT